MDAELAAKAAAKYDPALEAKAAQWIQGVTGVSFNATPFGDMLKDGVVLCNMLNTIKPGTVPKPSTSSMPFKQMENVSAFLKGCRALGVGAHDCFETVDLYEQTFGPRPDLVPVLGEKGVELLQSKVRAKL